MLGVVLGFAMGYVAFTPRGHEIGNQIGDAAIGAAKKVIGHRVEHNGTEDKSAEQSAGAVGDDRTPR